MNRFAKILLTFIGAAVLVLTTADFLFSLLVKNIKEPRMEIWREVMEGKVSADIVALGDSRVSTDFVPSQIDSLIGMKSYNLGTIGNHFCIQRLRYEMFRKYNEKPQILLHFVDNWSFLRPLGRNDRLQFLPWLWSKDFRREMFLISPRHFMRMSFPWFRYHGFLPSDMNWTTAVTDRGYYPNGPAAFTPKLEDEKMNFVENRRVEQLYRNFLKRVKNDGVDVILVIPPMMDRLDFLPGEKEKMKNCFSRIAEDLDVELLDLEKTVCDDTTFFFDEIHLRPKGAKMFCDSLAYDLKRLQPFDRP